jgi:hypothetical protein
MIFNDGGGNNEMAKLSKRTQNAFPVSEHIFILYNFGGIVIFCVFSKPINSIKSICFVKHAYRRYHLHGAIVSEDGETDAVPRIKAFE